MSAETSILWLVIGAAPSQLCAISFLKSMVALSAGLSSYIEYREAVYKTELLYFNIIYRYCFHVLKLIVICMFTLELLFLQNNVNVRKNGFFHIQWRNFYLHTWHTWGIKFICAYCYLLIFFTREIHICTFNYVVSQKNVIFGHILIVKKLFVCILTKAYFFTRKMCSSTFNYVVLRTKRNLCPHTVGFKNFLCVFLHNCVFLLGKWIFLHPIM